jgi:hypothetical protein
VYTNEAVGEVPEPLDGVAIDRPVAARGERGPDREVGVGVEAARPARLQVLDHPGRCRGIRLAVEPGLQDACDPLAL